MFGYVKPYKPYLYLKDDTLYQALYCSVCKGISKGYGQTARIGLSYDIAFFSALVHNLKNVDVVIKKKRCIAHPVVRRPMANWDELTDICAAINVSLAYYKAKDDIIDEHSGTLKSFLFKSANKKVLKRHKDIDKIISSRYAELRKLEADECDSLDRVSDPFCLMMQDLAKYALGDFNSKADADFFYYLGKWVYIIDALDDYDKDIKKQNYNPFYYNCGKAESFKQLLQQHGMDLNFIISDILNSLQRCYKELKFNFNSDLIENIVMRGIPEMTKNVIEKGNNNAKQL